MCPLSCLPPVVGCLVAQRGYGCLESGGETAGMFALGGEERIAKGDRRAGTARQEVSLAEDPVGAGNVHRHHRDIAADGQVGGATTEGLSPAVGAPATFRKDQDAPAVVKQVCCEVC